MARSLNSCYFIGHLGRDAETKFTQSGVAKTTFSLATERRWKDGSGEWQSETDWIPVVLWKQENVANYLTKGKQIHVHGRLSVRTYEKDGQKRWIYEIVADEVLLLGGGDRQDSDRGDNQMRSQPRSTQRSAGSGGAAQAPADYPPDPDFDDVPF